MKRMKKHKRVEFWDDERGIGNGIIVTLHYGWSFYPSFHEGVRGFDTPKEAMKAVKESYPCNCDICEENKK